MLSLAAHDAHAARDREDRGHRRSRGPPTLVRRDRGVPRGSRRAPGSWLGSAAPTLRQQLEDAVRARLMAHVWSAVLPAPRREAIVDRLVRRELDPFTAADDGG